MSQPHSLDMQIDPSQFPGQDVYAVAGNPIAHSKSPTIHQRFAEQSNQVMYYGRLQPALEEFEKVASTFFSAGGKGMNVTVPFKLEASAFAETLTPRAQFAGAVNTLSIQEGKIVGDNTDGAGLVRDLLAQGIQIADARIVLLGAGGATRGVLGPLIEQKPKTLIIANRSTAKADELVQLFSKFAGKYYVVLQSIALSDLSDPVKILAPFDLVINATSAGLSQVSPITDAIAASIFSPKTFAYDMVYGQITPFMRQALQRGSRVSDGLGMLVEQAADAFLIWRGSKLHKVIDSRAVLTELRSV